MDIIDMTDEERDKIVEEIRQYIGSPRGQRELIEALERADESSRKMREDSYIRGDEPFLYEPMIARAKGRVAGRIVYGRKKRKAS